MEIQRQLQKIISAVHACGLAEVVALQPFAASLQSVLHTRALALQQQAGMPDTDYLLNTEEVAVRPGQVDQVGARQRRCPAVRLSGRQGAPLFGARP